MAWDNVQTVNICGIYRIADIGMVDDTFVERAVHLLDIDTQTAGGVCLRVSVNNEDCLLQCGQRCSQIDSSCSLSYTTFLIS